MQSKTTRIGLIFAALLTLCLVISGIAVAPPARAAATVRPFNLVYYGWHDASVNQRIVDADPMFLITNTPDGPWHGNADASYFAGYGIKVFSYITAGYEGSKSGSIPVDLLSNLKYIDAISQEPGVYGIFMDEVSAFPTNTTYLSQIYNRCKARGLKLMVNPGTDSFSDTLMIYTDYVQSSEVYSGGPMSASQIKYASRTVLLSQGVTDATTAASLTNEAIADGFLAHYACTSYGSLPSYLATYASMVSDSSSPAPSPTPTPAPAPSGGNTVGSVNSAPTSTGATGEYAFYLMVSSTTVSGVSSGQRVWLAANIADFPSLLTVGTTLTGDLDDSAGWWVLKAAPATAPAPTPTPTPTPAPGPSYNTSGTVASKPTGTGATGEYALYLKVTSSTVSGISAGQQVWLAANIADFPSLLTIGSTLSGNLDNSLGWWVLKK